MKKDSTTEKKTEDGRQKNRHRKYDVYHRCMKKYVLTIVALIFVILSEPGWAIENPSVRSPIVSGTVPPSSISSGLISTPNPIDSSSNLVITGNVTGGKQFRGQVPYGSTTNFRASLGSASLDSFLRYSTPDLSVGSKDFSIYQQNGSISSYPSTGLYRPFFSQSATVATTEAGRQIPVNSLADSKRSIAVDGGLALPVLSRTPQEMDKLISDELGVKLSQIYSQQNLSSERREINEWRSLGTKSSESNVVAFPSSESGSGQTNIRDIDRLIASIKARAKAQDSSLAVTGTATGIDDIKAGSVGFSPPSISQKGLAEQAPSYTEDKFKRYMQAAQLYLKQGRYYRAADSYTMAAIYKPDQPSVGLAYAGKSHALLAAGEYMTSALFLSRAIEVLPEYAKLKVDLVDIFGNQDKFASRIADVEQRLKISGAPELQFLLGHVYYQSFLRDGIIEGELDRLDTAKRLIDAAYQKLPNSRAVEILKNAVGETVNRK
jgi:tetratricopeptide (TPR) repeat protein